MATAPAYTATPNTSPVTISTANTNLDGTGTLGTVVTAGSSGTRVDGVIVKATETTTGGMVRIFHNDGSNTRLIHEIPVAATTASGTVAAFQAVVRGTGLGTDVFPFYLESGHSLSASTHNAEEFTVAAIAGDF